LVLRVRPLTRTVAPWAQCPSERPVRFVVPRLGPLGCGCLEGGVANTHGDRAVALRGVILAHPVPHVRSPNVLPTGAALLKHWCSQPRFGAVLMMDLPPR